MVDDARVYNIFRRARGGGRRVSSPGLVAREAFGEKKKKTPPVSHDIVVGSETCEIIIGENLDDDGFAGVILPLEYSAGDFDVFECKR